MILSLNFIEIKIENSKNLVIGCIYRHPTSKITVSKFSEEHLDPILSDIAKENKHCILMGDFNAAENNPAIKENRK